MPANGRWDLIRRLKVNTSRLMPRQSLNLLQELPLKAWFPMDMQQTRNYLLIFGFQVIIIIVGPLVNIGSDTFITGLIIHACGEFRVLKKSLKLLKQRALQLQQENSYRSEHCPERDLMSTFIYFFNYGILSSIASSSVDVG